MSLEGERAPDFAVESTAGETVRLSETLSTGPTAVVVFRHAGCSFCAEQLETFSSLAYDLWRHYDTGVLAVAGEPVPALVEMRDRFDLRIQLCSDPDLEVAEAYTGVEDNREHGRIPVPGTYVVDADGIVRYEHVAERPDDRTYGNYVRNFVRDGFEDVFAGTYPDPYTPDPAD